MDKKLVELCKEYNEMVDENSYDERLANLEDYIQDHYRIEIKATIKNVIDYLSLDIDQIAENPEDIEEILLDAVEDLGIEDQVEEFNAKVVYE